MEALKSANDFTSAFMAYNDAAKIKETMITNKLLRMIGEAPKRSADQASRYEMLQEKRKDRPRMLLVIDDAHNLKSDTLIELNKTNEKGVSILLAAHTQLSKKLQMAMSEEIGLRVETFEVPGIAGDGRGYLEFLMENPVDRSSSSPKSPSMNCHGCATPHARCVKWHGPPCARP